MGQDGSFHVVHILNSPHAGGAQSSVLRLATSPQLHDYKHSVICLNGVHGEFAEAFEKNHISLLSCRLHWLGAPPIPSYRLNRGLRRLVNAVLTSTFPQRMATILDSVGADLVHTHVEGGIHLQAEAVLGLARLPWMWTLRGKYQHTLDWFWTAHLIRHSPRAMVTAVSQAALESANHVLKLPDYKVRVIPNGIDLADYHCTSSYAFHWQWRSLNELPTDAMLFGAVGRLVPVKRYDIFVNAAAALIAQGSEAHFVIAGDGPLRNSLHRHICALGIESQVHLVGYQADVKSFLREIDVMVLSSDSEGLPNVLIEACAMGVPCIATAVGGVPEVLSDNAGILIEPGSVDALAQAMQQMLSPETRKMYARRARTVAERFSIEETARQYASLYEELLACR